MIDIRRKKVKAIYFNAFHCPECGLELHRDDIMLMTYPAQYSYYCDCGFRTTTTQQPGYEYEFEDDDIIPPLAQEIFKSFMDSSIEEKILDEFNSIGFINTTTIPIVTGEVTYV